MLLHAPFCASREVLLPGICTITPVVETDLWAFRPSPVISSSFRNSTSVYTLRATAEHAGIETKKRWLPIPEPRDSLGPSG